MYFRQVQDTDYKNCIFLTFYSAQFIWIVTNTYLFLWLLVISIL